MSAESPRVQNEFALAKTGVFWDVEDCPLPTDLGPGVTYTYIKSTLENSGYRGKVKIAAIKESVPDQLFSQYVLSGIVFRSAGPGGKSAITEEMVLSIFYWALSNPAPSNLMVIAKDIPEELTSVLEFLKSRNYNVLLAQPQVPQEPPQPGYVLWLNLPIRLFDVAAYPVDQSSISKDAANKRGISEERVGGESKSKKAKPSTSFCV